MSQTRLSLLLLAPLLLAIGWLTLDARRVSATSVDARTVIEMTRGIADHGLPYLPNGPVKDFPELRVRWNVEQDGMLWGKNPPLFAYLAAPLLRVGGLPAASRLSAALLLALAAGAFLLARRLAGDPRVGVAAAWLSCLSTPLAAIALDFGPYVLVTALTTWTCWAALRAVDERSWKWALAAGLLGGASCTAHVGVVPFLAGVVLVLLFWPEEGQPLAPPASWAPRRASLKLGLAALGAAAVALTPLAAMNFVRFGSPNPVSYGACSWRSCAETSLAQENVASMAAFAFPVAAWLFATALLLALGWGSRPRRLLAVLASVLLFAAWEPMRANALAFAQIALALAVDCSRLDMPPFAHPADGLGTFFGPFAIRSALQETPVVLLAALAPGALPGASRRVAVLAVPAAALFASLCLRANLQLSYAVGYPFIHLRYVLPAMPALIVLALAAVRALPWRWWHVAAGAASAALLVVWLAQWPDDADFARRLVVLRGTLLAAVVAAGASWAPRRWSRAWLSGLAIGGVVAACAAGVAVNLAIDLPALRAARDREDSRVEAVAARTPQRFALLGWPPEIDSVLALRASRDIEYADMYESEQPLHSEHIRSLLHHWTRDGRPIFALLPTHVVWGASPWPDYDLVRLDPVTNLFAVCERGR
ncbi:MAG TPA: glycosyltransferase family 39 protein [Myxococcales bacterium]|jgi:hypothetical protein